MFVKTFVNLILFNGDNVSYLKGWNLSLTYDGIIKGRGVTKNYVMKR